MTLIPAKDKKYVSLDFDVTQKDAPRQGLTLLEKTALDDDQPAILAGLIGRIPAGYKLFPAHTIADLVVSETTDQKEKP
jgi:hypothetical protein